MGKNNKIKGFKLDPNQQKKQEILDAQAQIAENEKKNKKEKVKKAKKKDPNKKGLGAKTKETFSELKKVNWPKFGKVVKTTGIVLGIVAIFTLVLFGIDFGLNKLHELLVK